MATVLLHICCGICSGGAIQKLIDDGYSVKGYFYNPNIHPEEEYQRRLSVAKTVAEIFNIDLMIGEYHPEAWLEKVRGLEGEPEGGRRCAICFKMRLEQTFKEAQESGTEYFTSTLSISPHKDIRLINQTGVSIAPQNFLPYDFKKENGFKKAIDFSKSHNLYRQNYCGCSFSLKK